MSQFEIQSVKVVDTVAHHVEIKVAGEPITIPAPSFSDKDRTVQFAPDRLVMQWRWIEETPEMSGGWQLVKVKVDGCRLKKDGTPVLNRIRDSLFYVRVGKQEEDMPMQLANLGDQHAPTWRPVQW